jgi:plasmid replication initiation protein
MTFNKIEEESLIEKRNVLNEIRENNMTLQELRFFCIYLSKINAREPNTRVVRFTLSDFQKIMELPRIRVDKIKPVVNSLLNKIVHIPMKAGGFTAFQLFKECTVSKDNYDEWYVEINAHDKALPLMFNFKNHYFTYHLWNVLRLKSVNQLKMYELLKQYEYIGELLIDISQLRKRLGIELEEYPRWERFKVRVMDSCQKALSENTDIKFTYEPIRKGRKGFSEIKFIIKKNSNYVNQLTLEEFIDLQPESKVMKDIADDEREAIYSEHLKFLAEACDYEFTNAQMQFLFDILRPIHDDLERYNALKLQYDKMKMYAEDDLVKSRFGYLKKLLSVFISQFY